MATDSTRETRDGDSWGFVLNALVGAAASVVLAFLPFSPVLGGAVAGYLQKGTERDGLKVGALAGVVASLPLLFVLWLVFGVLSVGMLGMGVPRGGAVVGGFLLVAVLFVALYTVGLSAVGGLLGVVLAGERAARSGGRATGTGERSGDERREADEAAADDAGTGTDTADAA